jgi:tetratricopeptide (TPR) repeat protein
MLLPLGCMLGASAEGTARRWAAAATALMALALALTLARGAWLAGAAGCAAAVACGGAQRLRARQWLPWAAATALAAVLLAGLGPGSGALSARLKEAGDPRSDAWKSRVFMASVAWDLAKERPLFGVGGGAFEMEYLRRQGKRLGEEPTQPFRLTADAHNDWLQAAAETGFPGLALWAALFCAALWAAWRRGGPEGSALAGILVAFGVQGCFHFPWDIVPSAGLLLLALAATAGFGREEVWVPPRGWATLLSLAVAVCFALGLRQAGASALLNSGMSVQADAAARPLSADLFAAAARIDGDDERPWNRLGAEQMRVQDNAAAAKSYQQALQILPSSPDDWTNLGLCLGLQGQMPGAAAALRQAVLLNPRSNEAWADEANAVYQLGRKDEAIAIAREGMQQAGGSPQAWFNLGGMLYNGGQRDAAAAAFTRVLALDPAYPGAAGLLERCRHGR